MYGQREIHVCYGDGLVRTHLAFPGIADHAFDLLVANPPYSVKGFLETLADDERNAYALTAAVDNHATANNIETFFIERAADLLKGGGVAAVILPASILSNGGTLYVRTRELLLQRFDIVAIAEFGSGTFGKTGTNTVTLFLRRKPTQPETADHYKDRVSEWFAGDSHQKVYRDQHLIDAYASHIGISAADYMSLLHGKPTAAVLKHASFVAYREAFEVVEGRDLRKTRAFRALGKAAQDAELDLRFVLYAQAIERDKLYHYVLAADQSNPVLLIRSPTENNARKQFLGYDWSAAKGSEGIKQTAASRARSPLYDEANRANPGKLNALIAANFDCTLASVPPSLDLYATLARLPDLLDFSRVEFEKQIAVSTARRTAVTSRWPLGRLSGIVEIIGGGTPDTKRSGYWGGDIPWLSVGDFALRLRFVGAAEKSITEAGLANSNTKVLRKGDLIISARGTVGALVQLAVPMAFNQSCYGMRAKADVTNDYLFYVLKREVAQFKGLASGSKFDSITTKMFDEVKIPIPPAAVQRKIVTECEAVDADVRRARKDIAAAQAAIDAQVDAIYKSSAPRMAVGDLALDVQYGLNEKLNEDGAGYRCFRMNEITRGRMLDGGAMKRAEISAAEFAKYKLNRGDVLFNRTNSIEHVGKTGLFDVDGDYCFASYLVRVVPDTSQVLPLFLSSMMNSDTYQKEAKAIASKAINQANINATKMKGLKVPVPSLLLQRKFVAAVEKLEGAITAAESVIVAAPAKKNVILAHYL